MLDDVYLSFNRDLGEFKQRQIAATDEEIYHLAYELYELTGEEIAIVEGK